MKLYVIDPVAAIVINELVTFSEDPVLQAYETLDDTPIGCLCAQSLFGFRETPSDINTTPITQDNEFVCTYMLNGMTFQQTVQLIVIDD